jgi:hypothetical protein
MQGWVPVHTCRGTHAVGWQSRLQGLVSTSRLKPSASLLSQCLEWAQAAGDNTFSQVLATQKPEQKPGVLQAPFLSS